jgi:hypothetical protein
MINQCSSCGGFCRKSGCERENVKPELQRTWVGLTDDELTDLFYNKNLGQESAVGQAIALLKERNT